MGSCVRFCNNQYHHCHKPHNSPLSAKLSNMTLLGFNPATRIDVALLALAILGTCFAEKREIYLALMEGDPVAFAGVSSSHEHGFSRQNLNREASRAHAKRLVDSHDQLLQSVLETGSYKKLYSFNHVINGFSVHITESQAKRLKETPGVRLVERDRGAKLMTTYTPQFLGLRQGVWRQQGGPRDAGEGIVLGFVDTGINPAHPSFANVGLPPLNGTSRFSGGACETGPLFPAISCNGKIISARFFSAGAQAAAALNPLVDILSPFDAVGHGSHVASIAAGNPDVAVVANGLYGWASGVAPGARIAVYKVVYPTVGTLTDVVAAIDQAVHDGVDALALSVGPDEAPEDTPTLLSVFDMAMLSARRAGVFVAQAVGNKGPSPSTVLSYSPWAVGVAAASTDRTYPASLLLGSGQRIAGVGLSGPTLGNGMVHYKLVLAKDAIFPYGAFPRTPPYTEECQYPQALDPALVLGSIVICTFSAGFFNQTSSLTAILNTARSRGFAGFVLVANPAYGDFIAEPIPFYVPGIMIPRVADAQILSQYYEQETGRDQGGASTRFGARAAIGEGRVASFGGRAPTVSRFSSRGPDYIDVDRTPVDVLKPDILAPGHQVWAAWSPMSASEPILVGQSFALLSGTSMATPHVIGAAALIKQINPSWTPSMIASAMLTTATKHDNYGDLIMAEGSDISSLSPATPFDIGSGLLNPTSALNPGLVFPSDHEDDISFLCSLPKMDPLMVKAATGESCTRSLTYPSDLNLPSVTISALTGVRTVRRRVKNVSARQLTFTVSMRPPNGTAISVNPPWFTIDPQGVQDLDMEISVTQASNELSGFRHGEVVLTGPEDPSSQIQLVVPITFSVRVQPDG
ncbi:subtilisin-like protease SBT2.4 isoform X2 [Rhodamnia argentea]|uniref:Subtilisin-like protease SBT2.4 isoform X2 n=1 Tax=Rhodamnia argentea TaxID=178133 RepID=A0A8B8PFI7_9MYRT|nr:subtilisin-like protease SBT2.4 isoform X2 [Rhodamnia argentea]